MKFYTSIWTSGIEHRMLSSHTSTELYPIQKFWFLLWRSVPLRIIFQKTDADKVIFEMLRCKLQGDLNMYFAV